tara:strand:+ start:2821 stop:3228 length:408 start_codon:yes stop_codon:yes gene_type:complete
VARKAVARHSSFAPWVVLALQSVLVVVVPVVVLPVVVVDVLPLELLSVVVVVVVVVVVESDVLALLLASLEPPQAVMPAPRASRPVASVQNSQLRETVPCGVIKRSSCPAAASDLQVPWMVKRLHHCSFSHLHQL